MLFRWWPKLCFGHQRRSLNQLSARSWPCLIQRVAKERPAQIRSHHWSSRQPNVWKCLKVPGPMARFTRLGSLRIDQSTTTAKVGRDRVVDGRQGTADGPVRRIPSHRLGAADCGRKLLSIEKGRDYVGRGDIGNGTTVMVLMDGDRTPLGVLMTAANESEVNHVERLLETSVVPCRNRPACCMTVLPIVTPCVRGCHPGSRVAWS